MSLSNNFPTTPPSLNLDFANVKALDPRVTFTRSTTATYYDGVTVAMAEQNLVLQSQTFDNASWTKVSSFSVTANTTVAPDGTTTADTVTSTNGIAQAMYQDVAVSVGLVYTYSFWMYKTTSTTDGQFAGISLEFRTSGGAAVAEYGANINSDAGALIAPSGWATAGFASSSIVSDGNYWKITVTTVAAPATSAVVRVWHSASGYYLNGTRATGITASKIIWGAQLEQRSSGTAYTATTTQPITNYIPVLQTAASGIPRFDHNPTTSESLGLLIEEQRTNALTYSQDLSNAAWSYINSTITSNTIVAPDGTLTGDKFVEGSTSSTKELYRAYSASALTYTLSFYAKSDGTRNVILASIATGGFALGGGTYFNVGNGTNTGAINYGASTGTVVGMSSVGNGWYKCFVTVTATAATYYVDFMLANDSNSVSYTGNGFSGIFIWGAQLEAGAFPTSYIATTTAAATRNADAASMTGTNFSSWYDIGEGAIYAEYTITFTSGNRYILSLDKDISNYIEIGGNSTTNNVLLYQRQAGTLDVSIQGSSNVSTSSINKLAAGIATNNFAIYLNGISQGTDTSNFLVSGLTSLEIGRYNEGSPGGYFNSHIRRITYYPARLTNAQLQALTS